DAARVRRAGDGSELRATAIIHGRDTIADADEQPVHPRPGRALRTALARGSRGRPRPRGGPRLATGLQPKSDRIGAGRRSRIPVAAGGPPANGGRGDGREGEEERKGKACHETHTRPASPHRSLPGVAQRERVSLRGLVKINRGQTTTHNWSYD